MGGIVITPNVAAALAGQVSVDVVTGSGTDYQAASTTGPWRPPQWLQGTSSSYTYMITVASNSGTNTGTTGTNSNILVANGVDTATLVTPQVHNSLFFVFDAVFNARHNQALQITEHPIQTGANISDHAYLQPFRLTLEIGMSDAMDSYGSGMWVGASSKSVSAYQTLLRLQAARQFLTLTTRLQTYQNMLIEDISPNEDYKTVAGLRATITFKQVFTATVAQQSISARPNATNQTQLATVQPQPVPSAITTQYAVTPPANPTVAGAGDWSSSTEE